MVVNSVQTKGCIYKKGSDWLQRSGSVSESGEAQKTHQMPSQIRSRTLMVQMEINLQLKQKTYESSREIH